MNKYLLGIHYRPGIVLRLENIRMIKDRRVILQWRNLADHLNQEITVNITSN